MDVYANYMMQQSRIGIEQQHQNGSEFIQNNRQQKQMSPQHLMPPAVSPDEPSSEKQVAPPPTIKLVAMPLLQQTGKVYPLKMGVHSSSHGISLDHFVTQNCFFIYLIVRADPRSRFKIF